jgi:hypothetical protein
VEGAQDDQELIQKLRHFLAPIAPSVTINTPSPSPNPEGTQFLGWLYKGLEAEITSQNYSSRRIATSQPRAPLSLELLPGVISQIPLDVAWDGTRTLPPGGRLPSGACYNADARSVRIADIVLIWSLLRNFHPRANNLGLDWDSLLETSLRRAAECPNGIAFHDELRRFLAPLRDSHCTVSGVKPNLSYPPFGVRWLQGQLVVAYVAGKNLDLKPGDVILQLDGASAAARYQQTLPLISSSSSGDAAWRACAETLAGPFDSRLTLRVSRAGQPEHEVVAQRLDRGWPAPPPAPREPFQEMEAGIYYLDVTRIQSQQLEAVWPRLAQAQGLIVDVRGYPCVPPEVLGHFSPEPLIGPTFKIPIYDRPGGQASDFVRLPFDVQPAQPQVHCPRFFLTDGKAVSYGDGFMTLVEQNHLGTIVGQPTAGTNGNLNGFWLPGGYHITYTGMAVARRDGTEYHGVQPHRPVPVTRQGLLEQRDEPLEKALGLLKSR